MKVMSLTFDLKLMYNWMKVMSLTFDLNNAKW